MQSLLSRTVRYRTGVLLLLYICQGFNTRAMEMQLFCNSKPVFALKHKMQKENILLRNED